MADPSTNELRPADARRYGDKETVEILFFALILLAVPFVLPIVAWVSARRTRTRLETLLRVVESQEREIDELRSRVNQWSRDAGPAPQPASQPSARGARPRRPRGLSRHGLPRRSCRPRLSRPRRPRSCRRRRGRRRRSPDPWHRRCHTRFRNPASPNVRSPRRHRRRLRCRHGPFRHPRRQVRGRPRRRRGHRRLHLCLGLRLRLRLHAPARPAAAAFDWESLIGVKLAAPLAGIALVVAAVFFLKYSIEAGWLQPPVRVAIGILVATALLVVCEMKAARRYPATANAMDAAAIAILFATFFAAHALWDLIPSLVTFGLLAMVTADRGAAVDQARIAVHRGTGPARRLRDAGTPVDGREPPDPALRVPAAAERRSCAGRLREALAGADGPHAHPDDHLSVGMGPQVPRRDAACRWRWASFCCFRLAAVAGLMFAGRARDGAADTNGQSFERTAFVSAALPLLFALYLAAVPAYGARPSLLFGFLIIIDAGLLAIAIARRQGLLHAVGALATMLVMATWMAMWVATWLLATRARASQGLVAVGFTALFSVFYLVAPLVAGWFKRPLTGAAARADFAAPLLLAAFPVLAAIEPSFVAPWPLMGALLALVVLIAWRAGRAAAGRCTTSLRSSPSPRRPSGRPRT